MGIQDTQYGKLYLREIGMSVHVPITSHVDPTTLITRDGTLLRIIRLAGVAHETSALDELDRWKTRRNTLLLSIQQPRLALWTHLVRHTQSHYPGGECQSAFARKLNDEYRRSVEGVDQYTNDLYLTIVLRPPAQPLAALSKRLKALLRPQESPQNQPVTATHRNVLDDVTDTVLKSFARYEPEVLGTYLQGGRPYSQALEFLGVLVNGVHHRVPVGFMNAAQSLSRVQLQFGQACFLRRGTNSHQYGGMLCIKDYVSETRAGMLDALMCVPAEFVLTQSFTFLGKTSATEVMTRHRNQMMNAGDLAHSQIDELDDALDDLTSNKFCIGRYHFSLAVTGDSPETVAQNLALCQGTLGDEVGLVTHRDRLGMETAFWAQIPGNNSYIARGSPITSRNFAALSSFHNYPSGRASGNHWGDAVALFKTVSKTPYFFNFHHPKDLGNCTLIGPSGGGKTVLALFLLALLEKAKATRIYFDKDRGAEIGIRAMGGHYASIAAGQPTGFNPCQCPDTPANRTFLAEWLALLVRRGEDALAAADLSEIQRAVDGNFELPEKDRRLSNLYAFFQIGEAGTLRERLAPWLEGGALGWVFDNPTDTLTLDHSLLGFDVTDFLDARTLRTPVLFYLFHRIDTLMDGRRICLAFDEGWRLLDDPVFARTIKDWLKVIRKKNGLTFFATQEPGDVLGSRVASTILSQSPTQMFLPNPKASHADYVAGFKLTEREFQIITALEEDSRCFLLKQGANSVVVDFNLRGMDDAIAVLSGTTANIQLLDSLRAEVGDNPDAWLPMFHERRT